MGNSNAKKSTSLEYTAEEKSRLEIDKLHAEVSDLRSWIRRWLGAAGGLVGVITAAVSIVVTSNQMRSSSRQTETKLQQADARLAQAERLEAVRLAREAKEQWQEITTLTEAKNRELQAKTVEIEQKAAKLKEVTLELDSLEKSVAEKATRPVTNATKPPAVPPAALHLILSEEGLWQPSKWPGGGSGITIGFGYDLGYVTPEAFESDWKGHLSAEQIDRLKAAIGVTGESAKRLAPKFADLVISSEAAEEVFKRTTLPLHQARTAQAFPGVEKLPPDASGALVSLIFNRGPGMEGDRRREMRAIRDKVAAGDLQGIADEIRSMKRLWEGQGLEGLTNRREQEALLVESALKSSDAKKVSP